MSKIHNNPPINEEKININASSHHSKEHID